MKHLHIYTNYSYNSIELFIKETKHKNFTDKEVYLVDDSSLTNPKSINDFIAAALFYFEGNNSDFRHVNHVYIITSNDFDVSDITKISPDINIIYNA